MKTCQSYTGLLLLSAVQAKVHTTTAIQRNEKKGLAIHTAQTCSALESHESSSWWYSWGTGTGFDDSFCDDPDPPVAAAQSNGMDFVPMFWSSVPSLPLSPEVDANLQAATYLLTFNEPEREDQANMSPQEAAQLWPAIEAIASSYDLQIVAPCTTDGGVAETWYNDFIAECNGNCHFDFTCLHLYYHAHPCPAGVASWACLGPDAQRAKSKIDEWYTNYGKQVWVTELACAPWGGAPCAGADHEALMDQLVPYLQASDKVFRYAWFSTYDQEWDGNGLNEESWTGQSEVGCAGRKWIGGFGNAGWQFQSIHECVTRAQNDDDCYGPGLVISVDNDACYCSIDECATVESTYRGMKTYRKVQDADAVGLSPIGSQYELNYNTVPTSPPTLAPTPFPSSFPSKLPTPSPTYSPTMTPTGSPTSLPPTKNPTQSPSQRPTTHPSMSPTSAPTLFSVWSREIAVECPEQKWLAGFGSSSWQIQTQQQCVDRAVADESCIRPLVLSMDDHNCYCALNTCPFPVPSHPFMETHRRVEPSYEACGPKPATWHCSNDTEYQSCDCASNGKCAAVTEAPSASPSVTPLPLVWTREVAMVCPNKKWLAAFGPQAWKIQTETECIAKATANSQCAAPLVLSMDDTGCYCSLDECEVPVASHPFIETHRLVETEAAVCGDQPATWHCSDDSECQSCHCQANGKCSS